MKSQTGTSKSANMKNATAKKLPTKNALQNDDLLNAKHTLEDIAAAQGQAMPTSPGAFDIEGQLAEDAAYTSSTDHIVLAESEFVEPDAVVTDAPTPSTASTAPAQAPAPIAQDAVPPSATTALPSNLPAGTTIIIQNAPAAAPVAAAEGGISMGWLLGGLGVVGGVAAAAGGGGKKDSTPVVPASSTVSGMVVAGPVIQGNQLTIEVYKADGTTLLGTANVDQAGAFSLSIGTYTGVVIAKVIDNGAGADYLDEATGVAKDLNVNLSAIAIVNAPGSSLSLNLTPLSTLAHSKLGAAPTAAEVNTVNAAVAQAFGLTNLHTTTIVPVNGGNFSATTGGLSEGEKYGAVLASMSGMDLANGGNSQVAFNQLASQVTVAGTSAYLSDAGKLLLAGGATAVAGLQPTLSTIIAPPTTTQIANIAPTDFSTWTTAQLSALTVPQIGALTSLQVAALSPAQKAAIAPALTFNAIAVDSVINSSEQASVLSGTATAGATVTLTLGVGNTHAVIADANGNWSYTLAAADIAAMGQGPESVSAVASIGNVTGGSAIKAITIDTLVTAPTVALLTDSGSSVTDKVTNVGTLNVTGTETGALVEYSVDNGTTWAANFNPVAGANTVLVRQTDVAGNVSASSTFTFTLDTVAAAPSVALTTDSGSSAADKITNNGALTIGAEAGALVQYSVDNGLTWATAFTPVAGANTVLVRQTDVAGNVSASSTFTLTLDTVAAAPSVVLTTDSGGSATDKITNNGALTIGAEAGALVQYSVDNGTTWTTTFTPVAGANTVLVRQTDVAGNVSASSTFIFTLDTVAAAPSVALTTDSGSSATDKITNNGALTVGAEAGALVEYSVDSGTTWAATFTPVAGANTVLVRQTDVAGNVSASSTFAFTLDNVAPSAPTAVSLVADAGRLATDLLTNNAALNVLGVEPNATLEYRVNGGVWSSTLTPVQGSNSVEVRQIDVAGNVSAPSAAFTFRFDSVAPLAPSSISVGTDAFISAAESTTATTLVIPASAMADIGMIKISGLSGTGQALTVDATPNLSTGTWQFDATLFANGQMSVQTYDAAGNASTNPLLLTKNTLATGAAQVTVGGDAYINAAEAAVAVNLNVLPAMGDAVTSVTVAGSNGIFPIQATASLDMATGYYTFNPANFVDGNVVVTVCTQSNPAGTQVNLTLDTVAPTGGTITVNVGNDAIIDATETSTATPLIIPTPAGETITGVTVSGTGPNNAPLSVNAIFSQITSNWVFDATQFAMGSLSVTVNKTDAAGNTAVGTAALTLTNTGAVVLLPPTVALAVDTGSNNTDKVTSNGQLAFSGVATGATIEYSVNGGAWSTTFTPAQGANTVDVRQTLGATSSTATTFSFTFDNVAPNVPALTTVAGAVNATAAEAQAGAVTVTAAAGETVTVVFSNGANSVTKTLAATGGADAVALTAADLVTLGNGMITVNATATDLAGNATAAATVASFNLDTVAPNAPTLAIVAGAADATAAEAQAGAVTVTAAAGDSISVVFANGANTVTKTVIASGGAQAITLTAADLATLGNNGTITVSAATVDAAGNSTPAAANVTFNLDTLAPAAPSIALSADTGVSATDLVTGNGALNIGAEAGATLEYSANGVTWSTVPFVAAEGANTVHVRQIDAAGNVSAASSLAFTLDTLAPAALGVTANAATGQLTITGKETTAQIEYSTNGGFTWSPAFNAVLGSNTVDVRQVDVAGNISPATQVVFNYAPTVTVATVNVGGDAYINQMENSTLTNLTVLLPGDTVANVNISQADVNGLPVLGGVSVTVSPDVNGNIYFDSTVFPDGNLAVTVTATAGGVLAPVTLAKDTAAPLANVTINVGVDTFISGAEINTAQAINVAGLAAGETVTSVYVYGLTVGGTYAGVYATNNAGTFTFDTTQFADGVLTVQAQILDAAGNSSWSVWGYNSLTKSSLAAGTAQVTAGGDAVINASENGTLSYINVVAPAGDTINTVTISGTNALGAAVTTTAMSIGGTSWHFDSTLFAEGALTVTVNTTPTGGVAGNLAPVTLTKDTFVGGPVSVTVGADAIISGAEISAATTLNLPVAAGAGETVQWAYLSGTSITGAGYGVYVYPDPVSGAFAFDATQFADGTVNVQTYTTDTSGNGGYNYFSLTKSSVAVGTAQVTAGGDAVINASENSWWSYINVMAPAGDAINTVTISGTDALGAAVTTTATLSWGNSWYFDSTLFADGALTVTVNTTPTGGVAGNLAPVTLTKDTFVGGPVSVTVGADAIISGAEISAATVLNLPVAAGETVQWAYLSGTSVTGAWYGVYVYPDPITGIFTFDATQFVDGTVNVQTYTADTAGNGGYNYFSLTKNSLAAGTAHVDAGGDAVINMYENSLWSYINVMAPAGDAINTVTISGTDALGATVTTTAMLSGGNSWDFDSTLFADGALTVTVNATPTGGVAGNLAPVTLTKDTFIAGVPSVTVGADTFIGIAEISTATALTVPAALAGETVQSIYLYGSNATGGWTSAYAVNTGAGWTFDATQFGDGAINVQIYTTDAAGNGRYDYSSLTKSSVAAGSAHVDAGGDAVINMYENSWWSYINVVAPVGDAVNTVTISGTDALGTVVTATATLSGGSTWYFDSTLFADGALTVTVNSTPTGGVAGNLAPVTLTKDTLVSGPVSVMVGVDTVISGAEISTATTLNIPALAAGETLHWAYLSGTSVNGGGYGVYVYPDVNGNFVFDATQFANGTISVQTYATDTSGNYGYNNFSLTMSAAIAAPAVSLLQDTGVSTTDAVTNNAAMVLTPAPAGGVNQFSVDGGVTWTTYVAGGRSNVTSSIETTYDRDWFAVQLEAGKTYTIRLDGVTLADPNLYLRDGNGIQVAYNDDFNGLNSQITFTPTTAGTYYLDAGGWSSNTGTYHLSVTDTGAAPDLASAVNYAAEVAANATTTATMPSLLSSFTPLQGVNTVQFRTVDAMGAASNATTFSFTYDSIAPTVAVAPSVTVGADAVVSAAEVSVATPLTVAATLNAGDTINGITVSGLDAAGAALTVAAVNNGGNWTFDSTRFANGSLTVQVAVTDTAGNVATVAANSLTLSGTVPAPSVSLLQDTGISAVDAITNYAAMVVTPAPAGGVNQFSVDGGVTWSNYVGSTNVTSQVEVVGDRDWFAVQLEAGKTYTIRLDGLTMADPNLYLRDANGVQVAFNDDSNGTLNSQIIFTPTTAGTYYLDAGGYLSDTGSYHLSVTDTVAAPDLASAVNYAMEVAANTATTAAMPLSMSSFTPLQGLNTVQFRAVDALGAASNTTSLSFTYDSIAPTLAAAPSVTVGADSIVSTAEISLATPLTVAATLNPGESIGAVLVNGLSVSGMPLNVFAVNNLGNWTFDSTGFGNGTLTVLAAVVDTAGNIAVATANPLTLSGATVPPGGATVSTANGDMTVSSAEAGTGTVLLNVSPINAGDVIQSVVVHGTSTMGTPITVAAVAGVTPGTWTFDSTGFTSWGTLTADVTVANAAGIAAVSPSSLNMSAWSFWTDCTYNDMMLGQGLTGTAAVVHAKQVPGQIMTQVMISGVDVNGNPVVVAAQAGAAAGTWTFDTTVFADNSQVFLSGTMVDAATNMVTSQGGALHLNSASTAVNQFPVPMVDAGTGAFISQWSQFNTTLNVISTGLNPVTSLTVTDGVNTQVLPVTGFTATGFNAALFNQGVLTVTTNTGVVSHLYKDTIAPTSFYDFRVGTDRVVDIMEIGVNGFVTLSFAPALAAGEYMQSLQVFGMSATTGTLVSTTAVKDGLGNWTFDTKPFADGHLIVSIGSMDAAGNWGGNMGPENQLILQKALGSVVPAINVGGDATINAFELSTLQLPVPGVPMPLTTIDLAQFGTVSTVSISGTSALTGTALTVDSTTGGVAVGAGSALFNASQFADGTLSVTVNGQAGALTLDTVAPARDPLMYSNIDLSNANSGLVNQPATTTIDLNTLFVGGGVNSQVFVLPANNVGNPFTCTQNGNLLTITANATGSGYGSIAVGAMDAAGNFNQLDFQVAVTSNVGTIVQGGTTVINTTNTSFSNQGVGNVTSETFDISGINTNVVINGGGGNDTFVLNTAVLDFAQIRGNSSSAVGGDVLQLTANHSTLNLGMYNHAGQQVLASMEVIDMATDAGANAITLTAADLFNLGGNQYDYSVNPAGIQMNTINGGTNDVVNLGLNMPGGFVQHVGTFNVDGSAAVAGGGYSKYSGAYADMANNNYLVELLIQNGVQVV